MAELLAVVIGLLLFSAWLFSDFKSKRSANPFGNTIVTRGGRGFIQQEMDDRLEEMKRGLEHGHEFRTFTFGELTRDGRPCEEVIKDDTVGGRKYWDKNKWKFVYTKEELS